MHARPNILMDRAKEKDKLKGVEFRTSVTYMEIYNEVIQDSAGVGVQSIVFLSYLLLLRLIVSCVPMGLNSLSVCSGADLFLVNLKTT